jgi:hypothetical protein
VVALAVAEPTAGWLAEMKSVGWVPWSAEPAGWAEWSVWPGQWWPSGWV